MTSTHLLTSGICPASCSVGSAGFSRGFAGVASGPCVLGAPAADFIGIPVLVGSCELPDAPLVAAGIAAMGGVVLVAAAAVGSGDWAFWFEHATGAGPEAARVVGIATGRVRIFAYSFSGLTAAAAGLIIAARIGSGDPQAGSAFTLSSVTAVVVGGTSVFGGSGTATGSFLGALLVVLLQNVLNQLHVSAYWQYVWTGLLTLVAVGFFSLRSSRGRVAAKAWALLAPPRARSASTVATARRFGTKSTPVPTSRRSGRSR